MVRSSKAEWFLGSYYYNIKDRTEKEEDALFNELNFDEEVRAVIRKRQILPTMFLKLCKKHGWDNELLRLKFKLGDKK